MRHAMEDTNPMTFTNTDKRKAMAIVHIFETSKPFGDYAALAVLNDGAGISYGINQFTHRSGSLAEVVCLYLLNGGQTEKYALKKNLPLLRSKTDRSIRILSTDRQFRKALTAAAVTLEMRASQDEIVFQKYLLPAIETCERSQFTLPLTLAVIYDSINHGSWEKIRDRVKRVHIKEWTRNEYEKAWIAEYVRQRDIWLKSIPRLRPTVYRTEFFLKQISLGNWNLDLPVEVHGVTLKKEFLHTLVSIDNTGRNSAVEHQENSAVSAKNPHSSSNINHPQSQVVPTEAQPPIIQYQPKDTRAKPDYLDVVQNKVDAAATKYDQAETIIQTVLNRTDAAKSLWTTVAGTVWQSVWAIGAFAIGLPKEVWMVAAIAAAALMLLYLYRQIALGKIRELKTRKETN